MSKRVKYKKHPKKIECKAEINKENKQFYDDDEILSELFKYRNTKSH